MSLSHCVRLQFVFALLLAACSTAAPLPPPTNSPAAPGATASVPTATSAMSEAVATTTATSGPAVAPAATLVPPSTVTLPPPTDAPLPAATIPAATPSMTIRVKLQDYRFDPSTLSVRAGEAVRLELINPDHLFHALVIPDASFSKVVRAGTTEVVDFVVDLPPGDYYFYCPVQEEGIHEDMGMFGTLVVEAAS